MYGWSAGSIAGGLLFPQHMDGPRLTDLKPQSSEYGRPIPIVYGTVALGGNVIWASDYVQEEDDSGGKGGPSVTTYSYYGNFAVAFAEGECSIGRLWAGPEKRLIWDGAKLEGGGSVRFYTGTEDQLPDPLIESYLGAGNVPAYRGTCYVVFERFPLAKDGNTIPFITAEIGATSQGFVCPAPVSSVTVDGLTYSIYDPAPQKVTDTHEIVATIFDYGRAFFDESTGLIYYTYKDIGDVWWLDRVDPQTGYVGPPLELATGFYLGGDLRIAWNNAGLAAFVVDNYAPIGYVSLLDWNVYFRETKYQSVCSGSTCVWVPVEMSDVVWDVAYNRWRFLGASNILNASGYGLAATAVSDYAWGTGIRYDGHLTPIGPGALYGYAAHLILQPSDYSTDANIYWQAFDTKRHILVDFNNGVYNLIDSSTYIKTAAFGFPSGEGQAVYSEAQDRFYVADYTNGNIYIYDPEKLTPLGWPREDCILYKGPLPRQAYANGDPIKIEFTMRLIIVPSEPDWLYVLTAGGEMMKVSIARTGSTKQNGISLADVVSDLSLRAGESRIDVSQLEDDTVDGYTIARQTTVRNAIDALRPAYYFDAVESGGLIKYVKRGGAPVVTIDADDLDARTGGEHSGDPLLTTRQMEVELPRVVNVNYLLAATDYSPATKLAKRLVGASGNESTLELPLVLTDTKAQEVADVNLQVTWVQRLTYAFSLPRKYAYLEPTDHIIVQGNGMRLTKATRTPQGILKCEAVADGVTFYTPNTTVSETPANQQTVYVPGITSLELM
jgi:hypothetical protein